MSQTTKKTPPAGQLRRSQVVTTFGPGAMLDLPRHAVLVGGLDHWTEHGRQPIHEERLAARVCEALGLAGTTQIPMYGPPVDTDGDPAAPSTGITCFVFPCWFIAQLEQTHRDPASGRLYRTRPLVHWQHLDGNFHYMHERKKIPVVPIRFVQACRNGHLSDVDWHRFVHGGGQHTRGPLWIDEGGTGGDLSDIYIRCGVTGARRPLADAKLPDSKVLGLCQGHRPWLGRSSQEACLAENGDQPEPNRLLVRSASNAYFAQTLRVISLPAHDEAIRKAVDALWEDELQYVEDADELARLRRKNKPRITAALGELATTDIWGEIERRKREKESGVKDDPPPKQAEVETLQRATFESVADAPDGDYFARRRPLADLPPVLSGRLERVVLVHKLREVTAQVGFTRFEAIMPDIDGSLSLGVKLAALSREPTWVPAIENRGEGVYLGFSQQAIDAWLKRAAVQARGAALLRGLDAWGAARGVTQPQHLNLPYVMLHSLSHLLIQAVALECGYAATAITERVYACPNGYGVLLYTGTTGSEGTLGGLVAVGRRIERILLAALELGRLCSNDPICAQHPPDDRHEERFLHGAACHGCLLLAESSCERRNELLDRALVVPTVDDLGAEFFPALV